MGQRFSKPKSSHIGTTESPILRDDKTAPVSESSLPGYWETSSPNSCSTPQHCRHGPPHPGPPYPGPPPPGSPRTTCQPQIHVHHPSRIENHQHVHQILTKPRKVINITISNNRSEMQMQLSADLDRYVMYMPHNACAEFKDKCDYVHGRDRSALFKPEEIRLNKNLCSTGKDAEIDKISREGIRLNIGHLERKLKGLAQSKEMQEYHEVLVEIRGLEGHLHNENEVDLWIDGNVEIRGVLYFQGFSSFGVAPGNNLSQMRPFSFGDEDVLDRNVKMVAVGQD